MSYFHVINSLICKAPLPVPLVNAGESSLIGTPIDGAKISLCRDAVTAINGIRSEPVLNSPDGVDRLLCRTYSPLLLGSFQINIYHHDIKIPPPPSFVHKLPPFFYEVQKKRIFQSLFTSFQHPIEVGLKLKRYRFYLKITHFMAPPR